MFSIYKRNELNIDFEIQDIEDDGTLIPVDLSGKRLKFVAKKKNDKSNTDINAVIKFNYILPSNEESESGKFVIQLTSENTDIDPLVYNFQIDIYDDTTLQTITCIQDEINIIESLIKE